MKKIIYNTICISIMICCKSEVKMQKNRRFLKGKIKKKQEGGYSNNKKKKKRPITKEMYKKLEKEIKIKRENEEGLRILKKVEPDANYDINDLIDNELVFRSWELEYEPSERNFVARKRKSAIHILIDYDEKIDYAIKFNLMLPKYYHYCYPFIRNLIEIVKTKDKDLINQYLEDYFIYMDPLQVEDKRRTKIVCKTGGIEKKNNQWGIAYISDLLARYLLKLGAVPTDTLLEVLFNECSQLYKQFAMLLAWGIKFNDYEKLKKAMYKIAAKDAKRRFLFRTLILTRPSYISKFGSLAKSLEDERKFKGFAINCYRYGHCHHRHEEHEAMEKKKQELINRYTYDEKGDFRKVPQKIVDSFFEEILKAICIKLYDEEQMKPLDPNFLKFVKKNIDQEELTDKLKQNLESRLKVSK